MDHAFISLQNCGGAPKDGEATALGDAIARVFEVAGSQRIPEAAIVEAMKTMAATLKAGNVAVSDNTIYNHTAPGGDT